MIYHRYGGGWDLVDKGVELANMSYTSELQASIVLYMHNNKEVAMNYPLNIS